MKYAIICILLLSLALADNVDRLDPNLIKTNFLELLPKLHRTGDHLRKAGATYLPDVVLYSRPLTGAIFCIADSFENLEQVLKNFEQIKFDAARFSSDVINRGLVKLLDVFSGFTDGFEKIIDKSEKNGDILFKQNPLSEKGQEIINATTVPFLNLCDYLRKENVETLQIGFQAITAIFGASGINEGVSTEEVVKRLTPQVEEAAAHELELMSFDRKPFLEDILNKIPNVI